MWYNIERSLSSSLTLPIKDNPHSLIGFSVQASRGSFIAVRPLTLFSPGFDQCVNCHMLGQRCTCPGLAGVEGGGERRERDTFLKDGWRREEEERKRGREREEWEKCVFINVPVCKSLYQSN